MAIYETPQPDLEDHPVIEQIHAMRSDLSGYVRVPQRWTGTLRRSSKARAIQGSNSIEGYDVTEHHGCVEVGDHLGRLLPVGRWIKTRSPRSTTKSP